MAMGAFRFRPIEDPVKVVHDGVTLLSERGAPLAICLLEHGSSLSRSAKFHRPRGPMCMRGSCEGCLVRSDGMPNVLSCRARAVLAVTEVETQNVMGSRDNDLLRITDWMFPRGFDHHKLLAGVPLASSVMQSVARNMAGLGTLPAAPTAARPALRKPIPALIVGAGPAGLAVAEGLAHRGVRVIVVDEQDSIGGVLATLGDDDLLPFREDLERFANHVRAGTILYAPETTALGVYGHDVLVTGKGETLLWDAETLILATGGYDALAVYPGNDLPGTYSARAAGVMLRHGLCPGRRVAVVSPKEPSYVGASVERLMRAIAGCEVRTYRGSVERAHGSSEVHRVSIATDDGRVEESVDALVLDLDPSPSFELGAQAGAEMARSASGFHMQADADGRVAPHVWATGQCVGQSGDRATIRSSAARVAHAVADFLETKR